MKNITLIVFFWFAGAPISASGSGIELLHICKTTRDLEQLTQPVDAVGVGRCLGLVEGVRQTIQVMQIQQERNIVCFKNKKGFTNKENVRILVEYLENNTDKLDMNDSVLTMLALADKYPCGTNKK